MKVASNNRLNVVPVVSQWYINQFDYNKDIPSSAKDTDTQVLSWSPIRTYGRLQIEHLGTIFQIYPKGLPDNGDYSRFEGHYYRKNEYKKNLAESLSDIVDGDNELAPRTLPFVTAEDLLKKAKEKIEDTKENEDRISNVDI